MIKKMHGTIKESSRSLGLLFVKVLTGMLLGVTFALIFRQLLDIGSFMFTAVIVIFIGAFVRMSAKWKFSGVLLFDLFCVMTAMLLRMYILIAPGQ
jgi:hypothetical protein